MSKPTPMSKETLAELAKIRRRLIKLAATQNELWATLSIKRAAEAVKDAILDGRLS